MNSKNKSQTDIKSYENKERSRLEWGSNMQIVRKGSGEIAMTEGELARFFGVTWRALNYRIQAIQKYSNLHPEEMCASKREIVRGKEVVGYAPLYPLSAIIALSFLLDSTEAHLFRRYACQKVQQQAATIIPIFLFGGIHH
ncbi:hypothetical protein [Prevotella nigrescens]|uniref:hypothetical protein n=1 Tax=Prevotella nigrescens TaxID=28133 RepID=UPI0028DB1B61|nr:hypothetical protein [Prevotella nigrescens]